MALCHSQVTLMLSTDINIIETIYSCQFQYEFVNQYVCNSCQSFKLHLPLSRKPFNFGHRWFGLYRYSLTQGTPSRTLVRSSCDALYIYVVRLQKVNVMNHQIWHTVHLCVLDRSQNNKPLLPYTDINWLVFVTERESVYCAVRNESLNTIHVNFHL